MFLTTNKNKIMTRNEIHASKSLTLGEKNIMLWIKENQKSKEMHLTYDDIAAGVSIGARNVFTHIKNLVAKGHISKKKNGKNGRNGNSYVFLNEFE